MANTLSPERARELMAKMEGYEGGRWVTYLALWLFAGIRPSVRDGEIMRLRPDDISLKTGIIHVRAEVSKVREQRKVAIQPNLAVWLRAYPRRMTPIKTGRKFSTLMNAFEGLNRAEFGDIYELSSLNPL